MAVRPSLLMSIPCLGADFNQLPSGSSKLVFTRHRVATMKAKPPHATTIRHTNCLPTRRPIDFTSVPSQIGCFTGKRPASSLTPWHNNALGSLICGLCFGTRKLRPLVPCLLTESANQLNFSDQRLHRFLPSLPCPDTRLRRERIGSICFDSASPLPETPVQASLTHLLRRTEFSHLCGRFPGSNDRQDSTFPGGKRERAADAIFPLALRVSGTLREEASSLKNSIKPSR
jgi:hypothetical protein